MMRWVIAILLMVFVGGALLWPPGAPPDRRSDLGAALIGSGVVAFAALLLERRFSREAEKRDLQLQLGLQQEVVGIDLSGRDLSGFYLAGKDLRGANLQRADLRRANLSGAKLNHALLNGADLRGAKLDETHLYPSETLYPSDDLYPGPIYPEAVIQNTGLSEAKYDSETRWPKYVDPEQAGAIRV